VSVKKEKQPLSVTHPELAKEADGWDPGLVTPGSGLRKSWTCKKGHTWEAVVYSRVNGRGCPVCSNYKVVKGVNDLLTTHPDIAAEANGWNPQDYTAGSYRKLTWKCKFGHIWNAVIDARTRGSNCPFCSGRIAIPGENDLQTLRPDLALEAHNWDPSSVTIKSGSVREWKCSKGHIWKTTPHARNVSGCPYCSHRIVLAGFNDLLTTHPGLAKEADGWNPQEVIAGSHKKLAWKCSQGHKWNAMMKNRAKGIGCPTCAKTSFDPNVTGWLYLIEHREWGMFKIGITNNPKNRVVLHQHRGWEVLDLRGPMDGHLTQQWETAILRMLKAKGADLSNAEIAGKFDGYSEAWSSTTFDVKSIRELMTLTEKFEGND
jgi:DNA-directed RNA polymerase subunit RPC12/RpoP